MQALLFAALLASARAHVDDDRFFAPVAGLLLGLLLFLRFDAVLGIAGVVGGLALTALAGGRVRWSFIATLAACVALAAAYMLGPMRAYAYLPIVFVVEPALVAVLLALAGGADRWRSPRWRSARAMRRFSRQVRRAAPVIVRAWCSPRPSTRSTVRQPGGKLTDYDAYALRTFTYLYLTLPALLAALFGYALLARQRLLARSRRSSLTVAIFSLFFFYKIRIVPEQFWMARRFLPVILPGGPAVCRRRRRLRGTHGGTPTRARWCAARSAACSWSLLAAPGPRAARPLSATSSMPASSRRSSRSPRRSPTATCWWWSRAMPRTPTCSPCRSPTSTPATSCCCGRASRQVGVRSFLDWARSRYARVLFMGGGGTELLSRRWDIRALAGERFQVPEYEDPPATFRGACGGRSSTTACTSSWRCAPAPRWHRHRRRHAGRPARAALPRQGVEQRPLVPVVARQRRTISLAALPQAAAR